MNPDEFKKLVERAESDTIDFKQELYDFSGSDVDEKNKKRAKFAKDILCMANTPREQSAYIILGVIKHKDGSWDGKGLNAQIDGSEFQQQIAGWVYPHPKFNYDPIILDGLQYGVITIPVDTTVGPYFAIQAEGNTLKKNQLYHRRDSVNSEADSYWQGRIFEWFEKSEKRYLSSDDGNSYWNYFLKEVDGFNPLRQFILVLPKIVKKKNVVLENLGLIPWSFVIDFDPDSEITGVLSSCRTYLENHRVLHRIVKGDRPTLNINKGTYWYFSRGMSGRVDTIFTGRFRDWQIQYDKDLRYQMEQLVSESAARPTTIIMIAEDTDLVNHYSSLAGAINSAFGNSADFILISGDPAPYQKIIDDYDAKHFNLPIHHFCFGLDVFKHTTQSEDTPKVILPSSSNTPIPVPDKDLLWLSEELDPVHLNVGLKAPSDIEPGRDYLRGRTNEISWFELGLQVDVVRDLTADIEKEIRSLLVQRRIRRINLYHSPGAGGTTLSRRIMWDLRTDYPTFVLRKTKPVETAERLAAVYALTQLPILVTLDGSQITDRDANDLYEIIVARQIPVVMIQVLRRLTSEIQHFERFLDTVLSPAELGRFIHQLSLYVPGRKDELENVASFTRKNYKSPFFLGLVAFERDFVSLEKYVRARLERLTDVQMQILQYLAFSYYYGQQSVSSQMFAPLLAIPLSRLVELNDHLPPETRELIIEVPGNKWRVSHHLIAEEILVQTLTSKVGDRRTWWQSLPDFSIEFVNFCRGPLPEPTIEGLELARRIFVYRDNTDLLGTEQGGDRGGNPLFAQFINDLRLPESKLRVLEVVTDKFPEEPHFWAHLGRLYALELKQFDKAISAIDRGISLLPNDHVLYHMRGMALRSCVYWFIEVGKEFSDVLDKARDASAAFKKARELDPVDEHGYISETQMIVRVLDYLSKIKKQPAVLAAANYEDAWLRESFQAAEDLLEHVRRIRLVERPSEYELKCRADLNVLYGRHQSALQIWDNLLSRDGSKGRTKVYAPPIRRQIVWTHLSLSSRTRNWKDLKSNQIERCVSLLDENLREEPNDDRNLRLWIQAARFQDNPPSLESAIEKVAYWKLQANTIDSVFYLFVLYAVQSVNGFPLARDHAERALEECRRLAKYRKDRTRSFEWLGNDSGLKQLVHQSSLGEWNSANNFWVSSNLLRREIGIVSSIQGPEAGWIEVPGGLKAFFVPGAGSSKRHGASKSSYLVGWSENKPISFYLGFSYEGLRAWSTEDPEGISDD